MLFIVLAVIVVVLVVAFAIFLSTYTVVEPNKAHVVVMMNGGRRVYSPNPVNRVNGSSYFFIPFLMKRIVLPLGKVKIEIDSFKLRDKFTAPAVCDVVTWLSINSPELAVESLNMHDQSFEIAVRDTLQAQVSGIARAAAMDQEILEIMKDRKTFGDKVQMQVNGALKPFGLDLIQLEIIDFSDSDESHVIQDYEEMRQAEIESMSRQKVAQQKQEAEVVEANSRQLAGVRQQQADQEVQLAEITKKEMTQSAAQVAEMRVAQKMEESNRQKIKAIEADTVGRAQVTKQATIEQATGDSEAIRLKGEAGAKVVRLEGQAEADANKQRGLAQAEIIKETGLSEAEALDKKADAQKKFTDAALDLEKIKAVVAMNEANALAWAEAMKNANISVNTVGGGENAGEIMGMKLNAASGANLAQMLAAFEKVSGKKFEDVKDAVQNTVSEVAQTVKGNRGRPRKDATASE